MKDRPSGQRARRPTQHTAEGIAPRRPACKAEDWRLRRVSPRRGLRRRQEAVGPHITVIAAGTVDAALTDLAQSVGSRYENKFNGRTFAVEFEQRVWRAGLA